MEKENIKKLNNPIGTIELNEFKPFYRQDSALVNYFEGKLKMNLLCVNVKF